MRVVWMCIIGAVCVFRLCVAVLLFDYYVIVVCVRLLRCCFDDAMCRACAGCRCGMLLYRCLCDASICYVRLVLLMMSDVCLCPCLLLVCVPRCVCVRFCDCWPALIVIVYVVHVLSLCCVLVFGIVL